MRAAVPVLLAGFMILTSCSNNNGATSKKVILETPTLIFSTYLGGSTPCESCPSALTFAQNTASDTMGNTYVTGATQVSDLPVANPWQAEPFAGSTMSAFVAKYDPYGQIIWCTYLGGNNQSMGTGVAVMPDGGVAVTGLTSSDEPGPFPSMNSFQAENNGQSDYFVTVFDADGDMLYSTCLGGSGLEGGPGNPFVNDSNNGNNIAVDAQGLVYITGVTPSGPGGAISFPLTPNAVQPVFGGSTDAFLCIVNPALRGASSLIYSSFLGGEHGEQGHSVAVSGNGSQIIVGGYTRSSLFPTTANGYRWQPAANGWQSNGFIIQFTSSQPGSQNSQYRIYYSTYLGGATSNARDDTYGIVLDPNGLIVATGRTQSPDFPMVPAGVPTIYDNAPYLDAGVSSDEPYLVKIDPSLNGAASLVYSTFLGGGYANGGGGAYGASVGVNSQGVACVGGEVSSQGVEYTPTTRPAEAPNMFPYTSDAFCQALQGEFDVMLMLISPDGSTLQYSTYAGGPEYDATFGLAVDPDDNVVLTGATFSSNFPLQNPAQTWPGNTGNQNGFVMKFSSITAKVDAADGGR